MTVVSSHYGELLNQDARSVELVERKGIGHPDTLADAMAERISQEYSKYCLGRFGRVPNHWVDKVLLGGGGSEMSFGAGRISKPINIFVHGKVTTAVGNEEIPFDEIAERAIKSVIGKSLYVVDYENAFRLIVDINSSRGTGRPGSWYAPASTADLLDPLAARANDATLCSAYAPLSKLERLVLGMEQHLTDPGYRARHREIGTDVKVLAVRQYENVRLVTCIPFIADFTPSRDFYDKRKEEIIEELLGLAETFFPKSKLSLRINTRDDADNVYLTAQGSAADTGDYGVVGRGNRLNGLITLNRPMSIEAMHGKNPVYHSGKLYTVIASQLAWTVHRSTGCDVICHISSSTGVPISTPDNVIFELGGNGKIPTLETLTNVTQSTLARHMEISSGIINSDIDY